MHLLVLLSFIFCIGTAQALDCSKAITTPDINACASVEQKKVEARLNEVYQRIINGLSQPDTETEKYSEMKNTLISAQRAWVKFREADCNAVFTRNASGTIRTVMFIGCMQAHAERRIKDLEDYERQ